MNFLQDLVNELSNESKDNSKELDELYDYVVESGFTDINQTLNMMSTIESNFYNHFSTGDESFENYQSYRRSTCLILQSAGIDLPVEILVPSFESATAETTGEKKKGMLRTAWEFLVKQLKRLWAWITGNKDKEEAKIQKVEDTVAKTKEVVKDIISNKGKTPSEDPVKKAKEMEATDKKNRELEKNRKESQQKYDDSIKADEQKKKQEAEDLAKERELEKKRIEIANRKPPASEANIRVSVYPILLTGKIIDPSKVSDYIDGPRRSALKAQLAYLTKDIKVIEAATKELTDNFFKWEKGKETMVTVDHLDWDTSIMNLDHYGLGKSWDRLIDKYRTRRDVYKDKIKEYEKIAANIDKKDDDGGSDIELAKASMKLMQLAFKQMEAMLTYYDNISDNMYDVSKSIKHQLKDYYY